MTEAGSRLLLPADVGTDASALPTRKTADKSKSTQTAAVIGALARDLKLSEAEVLRRLRIQDGLLALSENLYAAYPTQVVDTRIDWDTDRLVVAVNDESTAVSVRQTGADAKVVDATTVARLEDMLEELNRTGAPGATSWGADLENQVFVIGVDSDPPDAAARALVERVRAAGLDVRVELQGSVHTAQQIDRSGFPGGAPYVIKRGSASNAPIGKCALGFNALRPSEPFVAFSITAGHCAPAAGGDVAFITPTTLTFTTALKAGRINRADRFFPGNDFAAIRFDRFSGDRLAYFLGFAVFDNRSTFKFVSRTPAPISIGKGAMVCLGLTPIVGFASAGFNCGVILGKRQSYNDQKGNSITNNITSSVCALEGDSGGPLFTMPVTTSPFEIVQGVGIFSGVVSALRDTETGVVTQVKCGDKGYRSFHQPLVTALNQLGLVLPDTLEVTGIIP